jgi:DNA-binding CsgD family transcriptional regulator
MAGYCPDKQQLFFCLVMGSCYVGLTWGSSKGEVRMGSRISELTSEKQMAAFSGALDAVLASNGPADLCRQIVHAGFAEGLTRGCALYYLDNKSALRLVASHGLVVETPEELSAWDDSPLSKAIREKTAVSGLESIADRQFSVLAIALGTSSAPRGLVALVIDEPNYSVDMPRELTDVVSKLGAFYLESLDFGNITNGKSTGVSNPEDLTSRQLTILGHIESGLVNVEIAKLLMLSESTIRQETVRIYRSLGVGNRQEAVKKARALGILAKKVAPPPPPQVL